MKIKSVFDIKKVKKQHRIDFQAKCPFCERVNILSFPYDSVFEVFDRPEGEVCEHFLYASYDATLTYIYFRYILFREVKDVQTGAKGKTQKDT